MHTRDENYVMVFMVALIAGWFAHSWAADLNREALTEFHRHVDSVLVKCSDSHFLKVEDKRWVGPGWGKYHEYWMVIQWKGLEFIPEPRQLSQADQLNGLEWDGRVTYQFSAARSTRRTPRTFTSEAADGNHGLVM